MSKWEQREKKLNLRKRRKEQNKAFEKDNPKKKKERRYPKEDMISLDWNTTSEK